jgi:mono/diheme cytochrome c family protein
MPFETLAAFVRTSSRQMPPFHVKVLSDADLADIYAYLQSIPKPPDVKSLPQLNP